MSVIYGHPVMAATRALHFSDHVTKKNGGSADENEAYNTWNLQRLSSWKVNTDSMISRGWNHIQTNVPIAVYQHWRTLSVFGTGRSASLTRHQFASEHFEWIYQESCTRGAINWGYQLFNSIKSIFRSVMVFLDVIANKVESQHELKEVWVARAERLENLFTNVSVRVRLIKTLWETS